MEHEMPDKEKANLEETVKETFREIVLCLGGIFAVHEVEDDMVWQVAKSLDIIFKKGFSRIRQEAGNAEKEIPRRKYEPHPAIEQLLHNLVNL